MKTKKPSEAGFTIVELLVAITVSAIIIGTLTQVVTSYLHVAQRGRYLNLANSYVEAKVEALRNIGFNGISNGSTNLTSELSTQLPPNRSANMVVTEPSTGIKQIVLSVSYHDNGRNSAYSYTTYIGELGVAQ